MYLGFLLALLGWGVFLGNWGSLLLLPVANYRLRILRQSSAGNPKVKHQESDAR